MLGSCKPSRVAVIQIQSLLSTRDPQAVTCSSNVKTVQLNLIGTKGVVYVCPNTVHVHYECFMSNISTPISRSRITSPFRS